MKTETQKTTILVLEDEKPLLTIIKEKLEHEGMQVLTSRRVDTAFTAEIETMGEKVTMENLQKLLKHLDELENVDAIWLDHNLIGKETGLDFVLKFKGNGGRWEHIPIFVVSNTSDPALVLKYAEANVHNYYVKAEHTLEKIVRDIQETVSSKKASYAT